MTLLLSLACAPLQGGDYLGEPLFTIQGEILQQISLSEREGEPVATAIWATGGEATAPYEHEQVWVHTQFPSDYELLLFDTPPEEAVSPSLRDPERIIATGTVVLFLDEDADGRIAWGEEDIIGAADSVLLAWTEDKGYAMEGIPEDCDGPRFAFEDVDEVTIAVPEDVCDVLADLNCNGRIEEWGEFCE